MSRINEGVGVQDVHLRTSFFSKNCPACSSEATRETSEEARRETLRLIELTQVKTDSNLQQTETE